MANPSPDWSSLPDHLLFSIAQRLPTRIDALRFRAVCNSFRSSLPLPPAKPFTIHYYHTLDPATYSPIHFVIAQSTFYVFEPSSETPSTQQATKSWIVKVEESSSGKQRLHDPFSTRHFRHVTKMLPESLNLLDYRVREISKGYRIELAEDEQGEFNGWEHVLFERVVASTDGEIAVMALINLQVIVWSSEIGNDKWVELDFDYGDHCVIEDIVYFKKKFYVVMSNGRALTVDPKSLKVTEVVAPILGDLIYMCLAKSSSELFLIENYWLDRKNGVSMNYDGRYCKSCLTIFKLDEENGKWIPVKEGLEDRALFLCRECNFFLSAEEFSGYIWNCVYLAEKVFLEFENDYPGRDAAIFNLKDGSTEWLTSFPAYAGIFWPPPAWLFPDADRLSA